jgi:biopolymer transport protein ExbB/TolQ
MTTPLPFLVRMLLFLVAVSGLAFILRHDLIRVFLNTPILNGVILGVMLLGIVFVLRQVISLWPEVNWLRRLHHRQEGVPPPSADSVNLLAPMAAMLGENSDRLRLSPMATRAVLDGIGTRLDEGRELTRYMIGLLIFLGLLGTFWGLLETIGAVADAIVGLQATSGDATQMFTKLKASIEGPLKGMSTAFGASLFGLSASLVLGFLELQASQASGRFLNDLEEWLAGATRISSGTLQIEGDQGMPAYVEALLERTADGLDELGRILKRSEESRETAALANAALVERISGLTETMRSQQNLLTRLADNSIELRVALSKFADKPDISDSDGEMLRGHLRNVEAYLARLLEETGRNRIALADDLHGEFKLLARTIASSRGGS